MKRMIYLMSFLLLTTVLAGCISIPLGDEVMKISMDGVEFVDKDDEEAEDNEDSNDESNNNEEDNDSNVYTGMNNEENESNNEGNDDANSNNNDSNTEDEKAECEEQDHSEILENLPPNFYIPECAKIENLKDHTLYYRVHLNVDAGDWEEIFAAYEDNFGDLLIGHNKSPGDKKAKLTGELLGDDAGGTDVSIQEKEEYVELSITHYK